MWFRAVFASLAAWMALAAAQPAAAQLGFSLRTGDDATKSQQMVFDSNKCVAEGPRAMYVGGRVTNSSATARTNVSATLSGLGANFFLAGGQPASLRLGTIAAGGSAGAYWFIGYGCSEASINPQITITSAEGSTASVALSLTGWKSISANATGFLDSTLLGPGAVVGQVIDLDVQYSFGQSNAGDTIYFQPSGLQAFNASCFRLVSTNILSSTNLSGVPAGTLDRIFFTLTGPGNKSTAKVRYRFEYLCEGASTQARPYAMGLSGRQLKYTGNYDTDAQLFTIAFPGATNPFTISKTASLASGPPGKRHDVTYTITISNPSSFAARMSGIADVLPEGATFKAIEANSDINVSNSSTTPLAGATGALSFLGIQDISYPIAAGGSIKLVYTASMSEHPGTYVNQANGLFGSAATPAAKASFTVTPPEPLQVVKTSSVAGDPVNGNANSNVFALPGTTIRYVIDIRNPNPFLAIDHNSVVITDATPEFLELFVAGPETGGGPAMFVDGRAPSGLSFHFRGLADASDGVAFSSDGGTSWNYVPVHSDEGLDPRITHIRMLPEGKMAPGSSFSFKLSYRLK